MRRIAWIPILVAQIAVACSHGHSVVAAGQSECSGSVDTLLVTSGITPVFTWTPACRLGALSVYRVADTNVMWFVSSDRYDLRSGVRYGKVPSGLTQGQAAKPLEAGTEYIVNIMPPVGGPIAPVFGKASFIPR